MSKHLEIAERNIKAAQLEPHGPCEDALIDALWELIQHLKRDQQ